MCRATISRLLIAFTLLANLACATDMLANVAMEFNTEAITGDLHDACPPADTCRHSCHFIAHLLTLPCDSFPLYSCAKLIPAYAIATHISSFIPDLIDQPPRV